MSTETKVEKVSIKILLVHRIKFIFVNYTNLFLNLNLTKIRKIKERPKVMVSCTKKVLIY